MKRLYPALQAAGIEFASPTVSVQTVGGPVEHTAAAGAAASAIDGSATQFAAPRATT
jgi:hypothetical protein